MIAVMKFQSKKLQLRKHLLEKNQVENLQLQLKRKNLPRNKSKKLNQALNLRVKALKNYPRKKFLVEKPLPKNNLWKLKNQLLKFKKPLPKKVNSRLEYLVFLTMLH